MTTIYTHSNTFHPDELLAIALLQETILRGKDVRIVRTRDPDVLARAKADPEAFVIDVGFEFDPDRLNFDHHQATLAVSWPDGEPYSACGLVWTWLREQGALATWGGEEVLDRLERVVIRPADRYDNGLDANWPAGDFLSGYNRRGSEEVIEAAFGHALVTAKEHLRNLRHKIERDLANRQIVAEALRTSRTPEGVLVITDKQGDQYTKWAARLDPAVNLVMSPRTEQEWALVTTPATLDDPFSRKCPAPEAWRGRDHFEVDTPLGSVKLSFCHKSGFISFVEGTREQALAVARLIVAANTAASEASVTPAV